MRTAIHSEEVQSTKSDPTKQLGFEIYPTEMARSFIPEFYPDDFTQMKKRELTRYGGNCGGESVSIKAVKNREIHVSGVMLEGEVKIFNKLVDYNGTVEIYSPLIPNGGMECFIKKGELGNQSGWDPHTRQWMFEYTLDLVSTGKDEHKGGQNSIVTAIIGDA